jgi:hypothetical protein
LKTVIDETVYFLGIGGFLEDFHDLFNGRNGMFGFEELGKNLFTGIPINFTLFHYAKDFSLIKDIMLQRLEWVRHDVYKNLK